jgi:hypothetical protein
MNNKPGALYLFVADSLGSGVRAFLVVSSTTNKVTCLDITGSGNIMMTMISRVAFDAWVTQHGLRWYVECKSP